MAGMSLPERYERFRQKWKGRGRREAGLKPEVLRSQPAGTDLPEPPNTLTCLEAAHQEWLAARAYFDSISHPDLVEHAIHVLLAAEKRYEFLLREAKSEGLAVSPISGLAGGPTS